ncbi:MAG: hypothetical protein WAM85_03700 [Terracidiphilus sp.]
MLATAERPSRTHLNEASQTKKMTASKNLPKRAFFFPCPLNSNRQKAATIGCMHLAILGMRVLEVMFFVGLVGSAVVVIISFIEDGKELFGDE